VWGRATWSQASWRSTPTGLQDSSRGGGALSVTTKALKQNASLEPSPARTETTQRNHLFRQPVCLRQTVKPQAQGRGQPVRLEVKGLSVSLEGRLRGTCQAKAAGGSLRNISNLIQS
jgi:hypothetical protein